MTAARILVLLPIFVGIYNIAEATKTLNSTTVNTGAPNNLDALSDFILSRYDSYGTGEENKDVGLSATVGTMTPSETKTASRIATLKTSVKTTKKTTPKEVTMNSATESSDMQFNSTDVENDYEQFVVTCQLSTDQLALSTNSLGDFMNNHSTLEHRKLMKILMHTPFSLDEPRQEIRGPVFLTAGCADCIATTAACKNELCEDSCLTDAESCDQCFTDNCQDAFLGCSGLASMGTSAIPQFLKVARV